MSLRVLIVDDEPDNVRLFARFLGSLAETRVAESGARALELLEQEAADVMVTDLRMPGMDGLELARTARDAYPSMEIVVVTGNADLDSATEALRMGLADYLRKPVSREDLIAAVERAVEKKRMLEALERSQNQVQAPGGLGALIGETPPMVRLRSTITRVQNSGATVLVLGESGTGKELVARALHEGSYRAEAPFVAVNCAAVAPELLESELFGYEKGAFTGASATKAGLIEEANGGTFFLDEIGEMPLAIQAKMLRVLQEREVQRLGGSHPRPVDFRLVAATNRDLSKEVEEGRFREDLFYRLNVFPLRTPPLRDRSDDVPLIARRFLRSKARAYGLRAKELGKDLVEALKKRSWPGNVRGLQNVLERILLLGEGPEEYTAADLDAALALEGPLPGSRPKHGPGIPDDEVPLEQLPDLEDLQLRYMQQVLDRCDGNKAAAARVLGIHPATLSRRLGQ